MAIARVIRILAAASLRGVREPDFGLAVVRSASGVGRYR